jgi:hypothetical protein
MKLDAYILAPERNSQRRASQIPPIRLCVCMCIPLSLLGNGLVKTLRRQRIHAAVEDLFRRGPCRIREK